MCAARLEIASAAVMSRILLAQLSGVRCKLRTIVCPVASMEFDPTKAACALAEHIEADYRGVHATVQVYDYGDIAVHVDASMSDTPFVGTLIPEGFESSFEEYPNTYTIILAAHPDLTTAAGHMTAPQKLLLILFTLAIMAVVCFIVVVSM